MYIIQFRKNQLHCYPGKNVFLEGHATLVIKSDGLRTKAKKKRKKNHTHKNENSAEYINLSATHSTATQAGGPAGSVLHSPFTGPMALLSCNIFFL